MPPSPWINSMTMPAVRSLKAASSAGISFIGTNLTPGIKRLEILAVLGLAGDGERAQGAAVKRVVERDDLELLGMDGAAVGVHHLERAFDGLRAGVGEEGALEAADFDEAFGQRALILVVVEVGGMDQQAGLLADDFHDARMGVPERVDADAGEEIEVAAALQIVKVAAFSAGQSERITGIILEQVVALQVHDGLGGVLHCGRKGAGHLLMIARRAPVPNPANEGQAGDSVLDAEPRSTRRERRRVRPRGGFGRGVGAGGTSSWPETVFRGPASYHTVDAVVQEIFCSHGFQSLRRMRPTFGRWTASL